MQPIAPTSRETVDVPLRPQRARNDVTQLIPLLDKVPAVAELVGHPRRRPDALLAHRGYDHGLRRLRIRGGRRDDIHEAFLNLATCLITYRHAQRLCQEPLRTGSNSRLRFAR